MGLVPWAAGIVDGEGCIGAWHSQGRCWQAWLQVGVIQKAPLVQLQQLFGGTLIPRPARGRSRASWMWMLRGHAARPALLAMLPWLIIKREEALAYLEFTNIWRGTLGTRYTSTEREKLVRIAQHMRDLKH